MPPPIPTPNPSHIRNHNLNRNHNLPFPPHAPTRGSKVFHTVEKSFPHHGKITPFFPHCGKILSIVWKNRKKVFHCVENLWLPIPQLFIFNS